MALTHVDRGDFQTTAGVSATNSIASSSFTPAVGALLTVTVASILNDGGGGTATHTVTNSGFTVDGWVQKGTTPQDVGAGYSLRVSAWSATVTSSASGTVTATRSAGNIDQWLFEQVDEWGGHAGVGQYAGTADGLASGSTITVTFAATPAGGSGVTGVVIDNNGSATGAVQPAGWTETADVGAAAVGNSIDSGWMLGSVPAANQWTALQSGTFGKNACALEILAAGEASPATIIGIYTPDALYGLPEPFSVDAAVVSSNDQSTSGYLDANIVAYADITGDHTVVGILPAGVVPYATVSHDTSLVGYLPAGIVPRATVSHDTSLAGYLAAAVDLRATVSHDASLVGYLPAGIVAYNATYVTGFATIGYLPIGLDLRAPVTHDTSVAARLDVGITSYAPVTHNASVVGLLELGAIAYAIVTGASDFSTTGVLYLGAFPRATVTADRTASGLLVAGTDLRATVSHTASVAGYLPAGAAPTAGVSVVFSVAGRLYVGVFPTFDTGASFIDVAPYMAAAIERFADEAREGFSATATEQVAAEIRERFYLDGTERL